MKHDVPEPPGILEPTPLIIVEGFLSVAGSIGWSPLRNYLHGYEKQLAKRKVIVASIGPASSLHDRACELYYAIKGGTVDYGEEHSMLYRHRRYGRKHPMGLYPAWSTSRPLHFLGHSMGGPTIAKLQFLLSNGFFGQKGHPDMILSVTTVSAPFRGTQAVYVLGERTDSAPAVRPFSVGSAIAKAVHIVSYLSPLLPSFLDFHSDSRALSYQETSFISLLRHLWKSDWAEGRDATPFDATFEASDERDANGEGLCNPRTYYRSYYAHVTRRTSVENPTHSPHAFHMIFPPLFLAARSVGSFDFSVLRPPPSFIPQPSFGSVNVDPEAVVEPTTKQVELDEHFWANDGLVPVFSQWHPRECSSTKCVHYDAFPEFRRDHRCIEPGTWHVHSLDGAHHLAILPLWVGSTCQMEFWQELNMFMCGIDTVVRTDKNVILS